MSHTHPGTTYYHPAMQPMVTGAAATSQISYKKRRPSRIRRNVNSGEELKLAQPSPEDLYKILVSAAEGYVNFSNLS